MSDGNDNHNDGGYDPDIDYGDDDDDGPTCDRPTRDDFDGFLDCDGFNNTPIDDDWDNLSTCSVCKDRYAWNPKHLPDPVCGACTFQRWLDKRG